MGWSTGTCDQVWSISVKSCLRYKTLKCWQKEIVQIQNTVADCDCVRSTKKNHFCIHFKRGWWSNYEIYNFNLKLGLSYHAMQALHKSFLLNIFCKSSKFKISINFAFRKCTLVCTLKSLMFSNKSTGNMTEFNTKVVHLHNKTVHCTIHYRINQLATGKAAKKKSLGQWWRSGYCCCYPCQLEQRTGAPSSM